MGVVEPSVTPAHVAHAHHARARIPTLRVWLGLLAGMLVCTGLTASGPVPPELGSFAALDQDELVDHFTGDFHYSVPLMEVPGPNGGYPITLTYASGIAPGQDASWVGLGWTLSPGAIVRQMRGIPDEFEGCGSSTCDDTAPPDCNDPPPAGGTAMPICDALTTVQDVEPNVTFGLGVSGDYEFFGADTSVGVGASVGLKIYFDNYRGFGVTRTLGLSGQTTSSGTAESVGLNFSEDSLEGASVGAQASLSLADGVSFNADAAFDARRGLSALSVGAQYSYEGTRWLTVKSDLTSFLGYAKPAALPSTGRQTLGSNIEVSFKAGGEIFGNYINGAASGFFNEQHLTSPALIASAASNPPQPPPNPLPSFTTTVTPAFGLLHLEEALSLDSAQGGEAQDTRAALDFNRERDGPIYDNSPNLAIPVLTNDLFVVSGRDVTGTFRAYRNDAPVVFDPRQESVLVGGAVGIDIGGGDVVKVGVNAALNGTGSYIGRWHGGNADALLNDARNTYADPSHTGERSYFKFIGEMTAANAPALTQPVSVPLTAVAWTPTFPPQVPPTYFAASAADLHAPNGSQPRVPRATLIEAFTYKDLRERYSALPELAADYLSVCGKPSAAQPGCRDWYRRDNHIAAFRITTAAGLRYIYGIAVYNTRYEEHKFSLDRSKCLSGSPPAWCTTLTNLSTPPAADEAPGAAYDYRTSEGFLEIKKVSPYPTSYLLTAIVGPDYIDAVRDVDAGTIGPSDGDFGYWVRFHYERDTQSFKWRAPFFGASYVRGPENGQFVNVNSSQRLHDKGYFTYGERESWYLSTVETATHKAYLCVNKTDRTDGIGAAGGVGSGAGGLTAGLTQQQPSDVQGFARPWRLDSVRLFTKAQLGPTPPTNCAGLSSGQMPLTAANLEYDSTLMPGTPNTDPNSPNTGRLTLRKVWFTHLGNTRGHLSPYTFAYEDDRPPSDPQHKQFNPSYKDGDLDRWDTYQPRPPAPTSAGSPTDGTPPLDDQLEATRQPGPDADPDTWSSAWTLRHITEPSGRVIKVDYEADDYAFVQDKPAMRMFPVTSVSTDASDPQHICPVTDGASCGTASQLPPRVYFKLDQPLSCAAGSDCNAELKRRYLGANDQLFFKIRVALKVGQDPTQPATPADGPIRWQTVSGYAQVTDAGVSDSTTGWISLAWVEQQYHPLAHAAWQYLRLEQPELIHETSFATATGDALSQALGVMNLADMIPDLVGLASGVYGQWAANGWGQTVDLGHSYIRLQDPYGAKKGGGTRVRQIRVSDDWAASSAQPGHDLVTGYEYSYRLPDGTSSGVASYEPMTGGDDNPLHTAKPFTDQVLLASNYNLFAELPIGEAYYPAPVVGYSRVVRRTLAAVSDASTQPQHPTSIGPTVYEYYTARDFPVRQLESAIDKRRNPLPQYIPIPLLGTITLNSLAASQGYTTIANDMHGKLKRVTDYEYVGDTVDPTTHDFPMRDEPVKETVYNYGKTLGEDGASFDLNNLVNVVDPSKGIAAGTQLTLAEDSDFVLDLRLNRTESWDAGLNVNVDVFLVAEFPIPIPVPMPNFGYSLAETKTAVTSRYIHRSGILESVDLRERSAHVTTSNLDYDPLSGGPLLTSTDNAYGKPVYHYQMPARWIYSRMGAAYDLIGRTLDLRGNGTDPTNRYIYPPLGQLQVCTDPPAPNAPPCLPLGTELSAPDSAAAPSSGGATLTLMTDSNAHPVFVSTRDITTLDLSRAQIVRSGNRNQLTTMSDSIRGLSNPLDPASRQNCVLSTNEGPKIYLGAFVKNVLDASHTLYGDSWPDAANDVRFSGDDAQVALAQAAFAARDAFARGAQGIFRPVADYAFVTARSQSQPGVDLRTDGTYTLTLFGSGNSPPLCGDQWRLQRLHKRYSSDGFGVDDENALQVPSSVIYGAHGTLPIAAATNARRDETADEIAYEGFEGPDAGTSFTVTQTGEGNIQFAPLQDCALDHAPGLPSNTCVLWQNYVSITDQLAHSGRNSLMVTMDASFRQPLLRLIPGKSYVISGWVSLGAPGTAAADAATYAADASQPRGLRLRYVTGASPVFQPSGPVIDGWQRIDGTFTAGETVRFGPPTLDFLSGNGSQIGAPTYFDDIRIFPEDASLETYVYDPKTLRMIAQLDENNFASFFGYAPDGKVELVRRETVRGVLAEREARLHVREHP
jgi:hypothetical protein